LEEWKLHFFKHALHEVTNPRFDISCSLVLFSAKMLAKRSHLHRITTWMEARPLRSFGFVLKLFSNEFNRAIRAEARINRANRVDQRAKMCYRIDYQWLFNSWKNMENLRFLRITFVPERIKEFLWNFTELWQVF